MEFRIPVNVAFENIIYLCTEIPFLLFINYIKWESLKVEEGETEFHLAVGEEIPSLALRAHLEMFESVPLSGTVKITAKVNPIMRPLPNIHHKL